MGAARGRLCECADSDVALDGEDVGGLPLHAAARPAVGERLLLAGLLAVLVRVGAVVHLGLGAVRLFAVGLARHDTPTAELDGERVEVSPVLRVGLQHTPHVLGELVPLGQQLVDQVHQRGGAAPGHPILLLRTRTYTHVRASRLLVQLAVGVVQRTYHDNGETGSGLLHVQGAVGVYALAQDSLTTHNTALCIADGGADAGRWTCPHPRRVRGSAPRRRARPRRRPPWPPPAAKSTRSRGAERQGTTPAPAATVAAPAVMGTAPRMAAPRKAVAAPTKAPAAQRAAAPSMGTAARMHPAAARMHPAAAQRATARTWTAAARALAAAAHRATART